MLAEIPINDFVRHENFTVAALLEERRWWNLW
jgi:hypothetical protein